MNNQLKQHEPGAVGMTFQEELPFEEWKAIGERFGEASKRFSWALGDWLVYGGTKFKKKMSHDMLVEAERMTGVDRQSLIALATVCRRIPMEKRVEGLPFEHHQAIASISNEDRRERWLKFVAGNEYVPTKKLLKLSISCFPDQPKIITAEDYQNRKKGFGKDNYVPHLRRLISVLRKTTPAMGEDEIAAVVADFQPLIDFVEALNVSLDDM